MFIFAFGIWVIRVANLGAMDDRDLAVVDYYRNDDVHNLLSCSSLCLVYGSYEWQIWVQWTTVI